MERWRTEKTETERELTQLKASTELETKKADLSGHPQFQRVRFSDAAPVHMRVD